MIARHFLRRGDTHKCADVIGRQFSSEQTDETTISLGLHLYRAQKRLGKFEEALVTLGCLRKCKGELRLLAYEESAKILEHKIRNYTEATRIVIEAVEYLDSPLAEVPFDRILFWNETFQKRRQRLLRRSK